MDQDKNIERIVLTDENGEEETFELIDIVSYQDNDYAVLLPIEDQEEGFVILKVEDNGTEDSDDYVDVEDDATLDAVFEAFKAKYEA